jgi:NAD(P)-dependent dehydrogenase (short-subunit alcohol dehydrogenase family)
MSLRLENRVALVTGGTGALGRAVVRRLLSAGAAVHTTWVVEREVEELRAFLGDTAEKVGMHKADATDRNDMERVVSAVVKRDGRLDVLAALVGGFTAGPLADTSVEDFEKMLALNATTAFAAARACVPRMRERKHGRIVLVGAVPALDRGAKEMAAYSASKAAVVNLMESLSKELVADHITVNAVVPTTIDTPANRASMPDADTSAWLTPDEIAEVIGFLASDAGGIVTGTAVRLRKG